MEVGCAIQEMPRGWHSLNCLTALCSMLPQLQQLSGWSALTVGEKDQKEEKEKQNQWTFLVSCPIASFLGSSASKFLDSRFQVRVKSFYWVQLDLISTYRYDSTSLTVLKKINSGTENTQLSWWKEIMKVDVLHFSSRYIWTEQLSCPRCTVLIDEKLTRSFSSFSELDFLLGLDLSKIMIFIS